MKSVLRCLREREWIPGWLEEKEEIIDSGMGGSKKEKKKRFLGWVEEEEMSYADFAGQP